MYVNEKLQNLPTIIDSILQLTTIDDKAQRASFA